MSEKGEKTCPLCAEEMDLTDQQLKPCKCGYEICVWCWHHIMDMAEKDDSEGRCPACRNPYNKEKIVGMAANCERLVAEINMEKKIKSQKAKSKTCEERKQLSSVRVIQRNLVYIVGLPLNLADEDLLSRKEYFGQYGKVLKVSISRTAAGAIQHFPNNTCSVYISYLKEDEAVRCIQSVHGFILDDRPLRACFGTTKYCHAWLRNMTCNNPDCLYLHEIGSQEDSFTKDEIISAYTRSRVQQIAGVTCNLHDRSGNLLPPPIDEYCSNNSTSTGKHIVKNISNNVGSIVKVSTPDGICGGSIALPAAAAWGARPSSCHTSSTNASWANEPSKQRLVTLSGSLPSSSTSGSPSTIPSLHSDIGKKDLRNEDGLILQAKDKREMDLVKVYQTMTLQSKASETPVMSAGPSVSLASPGGSLSRPPASVDDYSGISLRGLESAKGISFNNGNPQNIGSVLSSTGFDKLPDQSSGFDRANCLVSNHVFTKSPGTGPQNFQNCYAEQQREPLASLTDAKAATTVNISGASREQCDWSLDSRSQIVPGAYTTEQGVAFPFGDKRLIEPVLTNNTTLRNSSDLLNCSRDQWLRCNDGNAYNLNPLIVDKKSSEELFPLHASDSLSISSNGFSENPSGFCKTGESSHILSNEGKMQRMSDSITESANLGSSDSTDLGEDSIISNILSMDFDPWDESLASTQNFAKMLGETHEQHGSLKKSNSRKVQNNDQSRFSFARQEEARDLLFDVHQNSNQTVAVPCNPSYNQNIGSRGDPHFRKLGSDNFFASSYANESDTLLSNHPVLSSSKLSVSRAQVSVPPGFSIPSRAPPPGFFSHERMEPHIYNPVTGKQVVEIPPSLLRNHYQVHENVNVVGGLNNNGDIEFIDPAILAVGKGRYPQQQEQQQLRSVFENEARLQQHLMLQTSLPPQHPHHHHQNLRFPEFGIPSNNPSANANNVFPQFSLQQQLQQQPRNNGFMSNGHLDGWNEIHNGNNLGELMRNDRGIGFNKLVYGGAYEDPKYQMPASGDLYNRRNFGI